MMKEISCVIKADFPIYGSYAIGRANGKVIHIKGAIPGETVEVRILEEKRDYSIASTVRVLEPSADRIQPECRYFGFCGGCHLQYIAYERQIALKEQVLSDCLKRIAKIDIALSKSITGDIWNYRHRGQFKVSCAEGGIITGFYREKTRDIVDVEYCPLMAEGINKFLSSVRELMKKSERDFTCAGITEIHISLGDCAAALIKTSADKAFADTDKIASMFIDAGFSGVIINSAKRLIKYGRPYVTLDLENIKYTVSSLSFFQSNWKLNLSVIKLIRDYLQPLKGRQVIDLYAGAGNFSLPFASEGAEVIAVEENTYAIEDGKRNLKTNRIKNCRFIRSGAGSVNRVSDFGEHVDVLIMDPPRQGIDNKVFAMIVKVLPENIVYISCNPATLSRDLKKLSVKYRIDSIRMIDFFPQTYHIESVAFLKLR
jgi:23S rRNA (uracil1939-C5)-methyltransferase